VHAGSWTVQLVHSVSFKSWERGANEVEEKRRGEGAGLLPEQTMWKNSTGGGRVHATSCEGTVLKSEVVNPV